VLANHQIDYGLGHPDQQPFLQKNGQLMGCPISFPILCAINVVAYWVALEEYTGRSFLLEELPVLVNGDDILFRANDAFYTVWKQYVSDAGFTLSLGKNYISRSFYTVNSEGFMYTEGKDETGKLTYKSTPVPFLNTGLLYASRNTLGKVGMRPENREMPFTAKVNRVISEACNPRRTLLRVHGLYRDEIREHTMDGEINLHAAPELGGLVVVLPPSCDTRFTNWQKRMAGWMMARAKDSHVGNRVEGPSTPFRGASELIDTDGPLGTEGRVTYQKRTKPLSSVATLARPGRVVCRNKFEPVREYEEKIVDKTLGLLNYQASRNEDRGGWAIKRLTPSELSAIRSYKKEGINRPLNFSLEHRRLMEHTAPEQDQPCVVVTSVDGRKHFFSKIPTLA